MNLRPAILMGLLLLGACSTGPRREHPTTVVTRPNPSRPDPNASVGAENVMGRSAQMLISTFGQPALDVREGSARKLQYLGQDCVLDAYLYPPRASAEAVVTHVDTRLRDGRDTDRRSCIASLPRR
jgi:hypothetical protein